MSHQVFQTKDFIDKEIIGIFEAVAKLKLFRLFQTCESFCGLKIHS